MSTIVIGAGMAGLAAARKLYDAGEPVMILEAKDRIGGRTYTNRDFSDTPVEFGAEFVHGNKVRTWRYIKELGLTTLPWQKAGDSMVRLEDGMWMTMQEARATHPDFDMTRSWSLPEVEPLPNEDWRSYLTRLGFDYTQLRYVKRSYANACGESMRFLSAKAMLASLQKEHARGESDYRILEGYDTIVNHLAQGLDIRTQDPVTDVTWHAGQGVTVQTLDGSTYNADALIIAVPLGVLQAEAIRFDPPLPTEKKQALTGLRMGPVIKLVYEFAQPILSPDIMAVYSRLNPPMWWSPSYGQKTNRTIWTAFVSGDWAMDLLARGEEGALELALLSLREELGQPELQAVQARLINWPDDPYTRGGYSYVLPGHDGARERLAAALPPLFWAGEATAEEFQAATVDGALATGERAAVEVLLAKEERNVPRPQIEIMSMPDAASVKTPGVLLRNDAGTVRKSSRS